MKTNQEIFCEALKEYNDIMECAGMETYTILTDDSEIDDGYMWNLRDLVDEISYWVNVPDYGFTQYVRILAVDFINKYRKHCIGMKPFSHH